VSADGDAPRADPARELRVRVGAYCRAAADKAPDVVETIVGRALGALALQGLPELRETVAEAQEREEPIEWSDVAAEAALALAELGDEDGLYELWSDLAWVIRSEHWSWPDDPDEPEEEETT
jgi:HEAT repeat protein